MGAMESRAVAESEIPVSQYLPYSHHVTENIISTKGAEYLSVWKVGGRSHQSASEDDVFTWVRELNNTLRGVASANLSIWSHVVRRRVYEYPESEFENSFCRNLDQKYQDSFTGYNLMVNDLYLTIVYRPVSDKVMSFFASRERETLPQKQERQSAAIKQLEDINRTLSASLKRYDAELLGTYEKAGHVFSSALEFLATLVNGEHRPMPVCRERFADYMAVNRPFFSKWGEDRKSTR